MMSDNQTQVIVPKLASLPPEVRSSVDQMVDSVFDADLPPEQALSIVAQYLDDLDAEKSGTAYPTLRTHLESIGAYFQALTTITAGGNFGEARDLLQQAAGGFDQVGYEILRDLSVGVGAYCAAVVELKNLNLGRALELMEQTKAYLKKAGKLGAKYQPMIDAMEPESLYVAAVNAIASLDFDKAGPLTEKAAQAAERFAQNFQPGTLFYFQYRGMGHFYKANYRWVKAYNDFNQFKYDELIAAPDLTSDAIQAEQFLGKTGMKNEVLRDAHSLSVALVNLLGALAEFAPLMKQVFLSTFKPDLPALGTIKKKVDVAIEAASSAGPQATPLVRLCNQFSTQVRNLEKTAKPNKKDFGAFSGLVSCALFLPLFLLVSWGNSAFGVGLGASTLAAFCIALALIGGFGYGAVRFRSWFTGIFSAPKTGTRGNLGADK
jgi:hypothetical protein